MPSVSPTQTIIAMNTATAIANSEFMKTLVENERIDKHDVVIVAFHNFNPEHLAEVMDEMKIRGTPTLRGVHVGNGIIKLVEGVHRIESACRLGLFPEINLLDLNTKVSDLDLDWQDAGPDDTLLDMISHAGSRDPSSTDGCGKPYFVSFDENENLIIR